LCWNVTWVTSENGNTAVSPNCVTGLNLFAAASNTKISKSSGTSIPTFSPWYEPTNDDVILGENISSVTVILDALTSFWKLTSPKNVEPLAIDVTTNPSSGFVDAVTEPLRILLWSNPTIASAGILNNP